MKRHFFQHLTNLSYILLGCLFGGCASPYSNQMLAVKNDIQSRGLALISSGSDEIGKTKFPKYAEKDRLLEYQEKARYNQLISQHQEALEYYQKAIEHYDQQELKARVDLSDAGRKSAATVVAGDSVIPYEGSDLEKLLCCQNALISAMATLKEDDINIAKRRMSEILSQYADPTNQKYKEKLQQLDAARPADFDKRVNSLQYKTALNSYRTETPQANVKNHGGNTAFQNVRQAVDALPNPVLNAASCYLVGFLNEVDRKPADSARAYDLAYKLAPHLDFIATNKLEVESETYASASIPGQGTVIVFLEYGYAPYKYVKNVFIPTLSGPSIAKLPDYSLDSISRMSEKTYSLHIYSSDANGNPSPKPIAKTQQLCDLQLNVYRDFEDQRSAILTRFITRNVIKTAVSTTATVAGLSMMQNDKDRDSQQYGMLLFLLGSLLDSASVDADTRSWTLLPRAYEVARFQLPAGVHDLELHEYLPQQPSLKDASPLKIKEVLVREKGYTFIWVRAVPDNKTGFCTLFLPEE